MHTKPRRNIVAHTISRQALQALGVLVPIRFSPIRIVPGRHPLGRSGDGMRVLRIRPFVAGEDNPRDIDKYSPPEKPNVVEWEEEAQASIMLLADVSASMATQQKAALRNTCLMQLTYSLWRAGDRVATTLFVNELLERIRSANLKTQMERLIVTLSTPHAGGTTDITSALRQYLGEARQKRADLLFVVSDFVSTGNEDINAASDWRAILNQIQRNIVPVIISFEVTQGMRGLVKLSDRERKSQQLTWLSRRRIAQVNRLEQQRVAELIRGFRSAGLDYMLVSNQKQVYPQLTHLVRMRRKRNH